ncbi:TOTE conflict system archaeo-eukaryotic primase domain-containing protein, partial [Burkholderia sp. BDU5]|uniref:TOTE conflict system archaeo-eukaryotic primase domain-containing protein n=1 Tax=Burkholderia sp. BDU5 TaxID=1385590 RepID=UPI003FA42F50
MAKQGWQIRLLTRLCQRVETRYLCEKSRIKCSDCGHRLLIPLSDQIIYDHLAGRHTIGVYPLLADDTCHFLAVDFDDADWREDAQAFRSSCTELGVPAALEISRSGNGGKHLTTTVVDDGENRHQSGAHHFRFD